jgi:hypothetical protein
MSPTDIATSRHRGATRLAGALMPRGIAAHYAASTAPTSEPTTGREKAGVLGVFDQRGEKAVQVMVRYWCANARAESPVREACRASAKQRQPSAPRGARPTVAAAGFCGARSFGSRLERFSLPGRSRHGSAQAEPAFGRRWAELVSAQTSRRWLPGRYPSAERPRRTSDGASLAVVGRRLEACAQLLSEQGLAVSRVRSRSSRRASSRS